MHKAFPGCHIEISKNALASWEYCGKEDTRIEGPIEFGIPPACLNKKGAKAKRNLLLISKGAEQAVRDGDIKIEDYAKLKHNLDLYAATTSKLADLDGLDNYWIVGAPGTGKSHYARAAFGTHYDKPLNKWWDDYKGQETVILDDFDENHTCLSSHLKRWADKYPFTAEVKGGATKLRPRRIVVTSNYTINQLFKEKTLQEAISRRFKEMCVKPYKK